MYGLMPHMFFAFAHTAHTCVKHVSYVCDTHVSFKLWVICTIVLTINSLLFDLLIPQTFFHQMLEKESIRQTFPSLNFPAIWYVVTQSHMLQAERYVAIINYN